MMRILKSLLAVTVGLLCGIGFATVAAAGTLESADNGYHKQKVVYHINDAERAGGALRNIQNHINAVGEKNVEIVVVTHSKGIDFLLDGWKDNKGKSYEGAVQNLANQGVKFDVCNNTLNGRKIDRNRINLNATIVPSGVATLAELQLLGYAYIKP